MGLAARPGRGVPAVHDNAEKRGGWRFGDRRQLIAPTATSGPGAGGGTMQSEMNEAPPEYSFAGMTVFSTRFGGKEAAVILEVADD